MESLTEWNTQKWDLHSSKRIPRFGDVWNQKFARATMFWMWYNSVHHSSCLQVWCQDTITVYDTVSQITCMMYGAWSWTYNDCHAFHVNQIKTILQWLSYLIFIFFILQACCYQGNNLRSKQKNQDKRSCFKGSKVYVRLPCIAVKCLIFV